MRQTTFSNPAVKFRRFARKGFALFAALHKVVVIGVLSAPMLAGAATHGAHISDQRMPQATTDEAADTIAGGTLDDISVIGTRAPQTAGQTVRMVSVITREDIAHLPAQSIDDLLKHFAAIDVRQRGPLGAQADIGLRGGTNEQVAILLDGINIADPQTGHNTLLLPIDIADIERIEVLEGPAARAYGTQSLLGAINIITSQSTTTGARLEAGSYGYAQTAVQVGIRNKGLGTFSRQTTMREPIPHYSLLTPNYKLFASASYTRSDGYTRSRGGHLNGDLEAVRAAVRGYASLPTADIAFLAGVATKGYGANTFYGARWDDQAERLTKTFARLTATAHGTPHLAATVYWNHTYDRFELYRDDESRTPFNHHLTDVIGLSATSHFDWTLGRTALAADLRNEDIKSTNLGEPLTHPDGRYTHGLNRTNITLTAEHNITLGPLRLSAGVVAAKSSWGKDGLHLYPGADAALRLNRHWKLYASCNTSLRLPTATELYYSVGGHKADPDLKAEKITALEAGIGYTATHIEATARVFHNHYTDLIDWVRQTDDGPDAPWQSRNFATINALGFQTGATVRLKTVTASLHYTYINQRKGDTSGLQSRYALEYLRHKLNADATLRLPAHLALTLACRVQQRRGTFTDTDGTVRPYEPYALLDAKLTWSRHIYKVSLQADNIFATRYYDLAAVPQPGRWFTAALSITIR